jgi:phage portal protein BeeE
VIDGWGRTPQPYRNPNPLPLAGEGEGEWIFPPAYQQVLKGLPAVNYSARDIVYRPRNVRAHRVYGYSPVQQVLMTVNIALRRQLWQLDYFSEGSIPDALIGVPQGWTPDQIKQFQDYPLPSLPRERGREGRGVLRRSRQAAAAPNSCRATP